MSNAHGYEVTSESLDKLIGLVKVLRNVFAALTIALVIVSHPPCPCALLGLPFFTITGIIWWLLHGQYKKLLRIKEGREVESVSSEEIAASVASRRGSSA